MVSKRYNLKKKRPKISIQNSSLANPTLRNKHICKRANQKENSIDVPTTTASQFYYN
jgi:hypothetical protein